MLTALLTVDNILGAHHDIWAVNVEEEYHEESGDSTGSTTGRVRRGYRGSPGWIPLTWRPASSWCAGGGRSSTS